MAKGQKMSCVTSSVTCITSLALREPKTCIFAFCTSTFWGCLMHDWNDRSTDLGLFFFFFFTKNLKLWCLWWHVKMSAVKKVLLNLTLKNWLCCYFLESHLVKFYMFIGEILVLYVSFWLVDLFQIYGHVFNLPHNPDWSVVMSFAWPLLWLVHTTLSHLGGVSLLSET